MSGSTWIYSKNFKKYTKPEARTLYLEWDREFHKNMHNINDYTLEDQYLALAEWDKEFNGGLELQNHSYGWLMHYDITQLENLITKYHLEKTPLMHALTWAKNNYIAQLKYIEEIRKKNNINN